jgi:hypothetical protein
MRLIALVLAFSLPAAAPAMAQYAPYARSPADTAAEHQLMRMRLQAQADERAALARANAAAARAATLDLERARTPLVDPVDARVATDRLTAEEARAAAEASRDASARRQAILSQTSQVDAWLDRARPE